MRLDRQHDGDGEAVDHVAGLGHRHIARVAGPPDHGHVWIRDQAFAAATRRTGLSAEVVHTDFTGDQGAAATRRLMSSAHRPSAIIFGNDLMAVAGLSTLAELGYGAAVATRLFDLLEGAAPAAHLYSTPKLQARQSSGPPPGGAAHG